ncbi:MAG: lipocalin-like domain-containing protein [Anaerolineales bacterium]|nr:lipocalin-like domain-containing protein [Anaerolineales bacterium]MCZ2122532.1 lipocalin-like domain-containing protein [Anaerolineales bacterium]
MTISDSIIGAWKLRQFKFEAKGNRIIYPFGKAAVGSIIYTETMRFSGQLMKAERPRFQIADQMRGTIEEVLANYQGVISYFGSYQVDVAQGIVTHHVEGSIFPNMEGTQQIRYFELQENVLQLRTPTFKLNQEIVTGTIVWQRVE